MESHLQMQMRITGINLHRNAESAEHAVPAEINSHPHAQRHGGLGIGVGETIYLKRM